MTGQFRQVSVLTSNIKRLLIESLTGHFYGDPVYRKKLKIVNKKSDLEKFHIGIFIRNVSASKIQFCPDNYLGKIRAFSSLAGAGNHPSRFVDFATDDEYNIYRSVVEEDLSSQATGSNTLFTTNLKPVVKQCKASGQPYYADEPSNVLVSVNGSVVGVSSVDGRIGLITLTKAPPVGATVLVSYLKRHIIAPGYYFLELQANNKVVMDQFEAVERLPIKFNLPEVKLKFTTGLLTTSGVKIFIDGTELTTGFTTQAAGNFIQFDTRPDGVNIQIKNKITNAVLNAGTDWHFDRYHEETLVASATGIEQYLFVTKLTYKNLVLEVNNVPLVSNLEVTSINDSHDYNIVGRRLELLGALPQFSKVVAKYTYTDTSVLATVPLDTLFGDATTVQLRDTNLFDQMFEIYEGMNLVSATTYSVDFVNGLITFKDLPILGKDYVVCYRLFRGTAGPFTVKPNTWDNSIIPGVILYFGRMFDVGDKICVLVGEQQKECADEYGGKWELSVDLAVAALDPIVSEQLADELVMFLWAGLKPKFDAVGLFIQDVSHGGESEEEIDEATGNTDFQASVSLVVLGDWFLRVPRKNRIMSISSTSTTIDPSWEPAGLFYPDFRSGSNTMFKFVPERIAKS